MAHDFNVIEFTGLKELPHFDPALSANIAPAIIQEFRKSVEDAEGILICTPEYIFSIPAGLKNALEWCVATTVFSGKPTGLITASSAGQKAHEELQLIMQTLTARLSNETTLLISGPKSKINNEGIIIDAKTEDEIIHFCEAYAKFFPGLVSITKS